MTRGLIFKRSSTRGIWLPRNHAGACRDKFGLHGAGWGGALFWGLKSLLWNPREICRPIWWTVKQKRQTFRIMGTHRVDPQDPQTQVVNFSNWSFDDVPGGGFPEYIPVSHLCFRNGFQQSDTDTGPVDFHCFPVFFRDVFFLVDTNCLRLTDRVGYNQPQTSAAMHCGKLLTVRRVRCRRCRKHLESTWPELHQSKCIEKPTNVRHIETRIFWCRHYGER